MSIPDAPDEDKSPVMINYLLVKLNLGNNSFELFELLQALENTERDEIFKSKAIQNIIKYLWIRAKWTNISQFIV